METHDMRARHIVLMQRTVATLGNILQKVTPDQATTLRDGPGGWTILEALGHLRAFDGYFQARAAMMLAEENPQLPAYDEAALAQEQAYNTRDLHAEFAALHESRAAFVAFFQNLSDAEWARTGIHPENGPWTMDHALMQVGLHDMSHIEQITRVLAERGGAA